VNRFEARLRIFTESTDSLRSVKIARLGVMPCSLLQFYDILQNGFLMQFRL
jgi:hypothetical protein